MKQMYHSNVLTNVHIRSDIYGSNLKISEIAEKFNISQATVSKWKNRENLQDRRELNVKTPFDAVEKWFKIKPQIFKENPLQFKTKILSLLRNLENKVPLTTL